jgi:hypothetical protein
MCTGLLNSIFHSTCRSEFPWHSLFKPLQNQQYQLDIYRSPCHSRCKGLILLETFTTLADEELIASLPPFLRSVSLLFMRIPAVFRPLFSTDNLQRDMATKRIFWGFSINRFLMTPLHYLSSRSDFGFEFAEIFVIENHSPTRLFGESTRFSRVALFSNF